jgi:hypothetical protein
MPPLGPKDWSPIPRKKFLVSVREVYIQVVEVVAASPKDAIGRVADGQGELMSSPEYSHTLELDTWTVEAKED